MNSSLNKQNFEIINGADTFANMYQRFVCYVDVGEKSLHTYSQNLKPFMRYLAANGITMPTREDVKQYKDLLINEGKKPATIKGYLAVVKVFFSWLEDEGLYKNVAKHVKCPKATAMHTGDYLSASQMAKLLECIKRTHTRAAERDFIICNLMVSLGLRTVEIERANVGHFRMKDESFFLEIQGKGNKIVSKKLDTSVANMIAGYIESRGDVSPDAPLFVSESNNCSDNGRIPAKSISRIIKTHLTNAGMFSNRITAHSLRHTAAMLKLKTCNGDLRETQEFMRHSDPKTTLIYLKELEAEKDTSSCDIMEQIRNVK